MTDLLPCPFCGAGTTEIQPGQCTWLGMRYSDPITYSVRHWCPKGKGDITGLNITMTGRDEVTAIAAWNQRTPAVTDSSGCIFCDIDLEPFEAEGFRWHKTNGHDPVRCMKRNC